MDNTTAFPELKSFPVDKIVSSPYQARQDFDEVKLKCLAESMKGNGLDQPIGIRLLPDGTGELMWGERRLRAAKINGWTEIKALVHQGIPDQDAAEKGLIENLQREDLNPIERAKGYKRLSDMGLTQDEIAKKVGISDRISVYRYLSLLELPQEIQDMLPRGNISEAHTRSIRQIPDKTKQIELARQADKEGWSIKETEKRVKAVISTTGNRNGDRDGVRESGNVASSPSLSRSPIPQPVDPLASFWPTVTLNPVLVPQGAWWVSYKEISEGPVYIFTILADEATPKAGIAKFAQALQEAIGDTKVEEDRVNSLAQAAMPGSVSEFKQIEAEQKNQRIPKTPQEWKEVEALAVKEGPYGMYRWALGQNSLLAQKMKGLTWDKLKENDPVAACHQYFEGVAQMRELEKRNTLENREPQEEEMDPEIAAMVEDHMQKGPLS